MRCPYCHDNDDKVIDSRDTDGGKAVRRRRECLACGKRFTTYEHVKENTRLFVIKKDQSRVPYDRDKMIAGLQKACYKRFVTAEDISKIVDDVEDAMFRRGDSEVRSDQIGRALAERLKCIDQVAYLRFASVYMQFRNVDDLIEEAREVKASQPEAESPDQGSLF